jgi:putative selenate reductase
MDAARAAKRLPGVEKVSLVYRRTRRYMPADEDELALALAEGVVFRELLAPVSLAGGILTCRKMVLGEADARGRRRPVETAELCRIPADMVVSAVGDKPDSGFYRACGLALDKGGLPVVREETRESSLPGVYVIGDGRSGPATVVEAIADGAKAAAAILAKAGQAWREKAPGWRHEPAELACRQGVLRPALAEEKEGERCLECDVLCENCAQVCPNRANVAVAIPGWKKSQIIHLDALCNECGNCQTFCPYDSAPYREKLTLFGRMEDFADSQNQGFFLQDAKAGSFQVRLAGKLYTWRCGKRKSGEARQGEQALPEEIGQLLRALLFGYQYLFL